MRRRSASLPRLRGRPRTPRTAEPPVLTTSLDLLERPLEQVHFVLGGPGLEQDAPEILRRCREDGAHVALLVPL